MSKSKDGLKLPAAILFDHDGTLVDTEPLWEAAKQAICQEYGLTWTGEDTLAVLGYSIHKTLTRLQQIGVPLSLADIERKLIASMQEALKRATYEFLPGIAEFLAEIKEAGIPCAIVTNATTSIAQATAQLAPDIFTTVIGDQQTQNPKPHPEPYLLAAQALGVKPADCIAIEDSPSGVRSASAAGMKVVVVPGQAAVPAGEGDLRLSHTELNLKDSLILSNSK